MRAARCTHAFNPQGFVVPAVGFNPPGITHRAMTEMIHSCDAAEHTLCLSGDTRVRALIGPTRQALFRLDCRRLL